AKDELNGPRGDGYRRMIESSAGGRAGTPNEVGAVGALLMGPDGGFIPGSDILMDGGVTAASSRAPLRVGSCCVPPRPDAQELCPSDRCVSAGAGLVTLRRCEESTMLRSNDGTLDDGGGACCVT